MKKKPIRCYTVDGKPMTPDDLKRLHDYLVDIDTIAIISDEMRVVIESECPELAHKLPPKSSDRRNREPLQQQGTEISNLEGCRDDSYLKRDPSCRDFPCESDPRQNRPRREDSWHKNEHFESECQDRTHEKTGDYGHAHRTSPCPQNN